MPWFVWLLAAAALGVAEFFTLTLVLGLLAGRRWSPPWSPVWASGSSARSWPWRRRLRRASSLSVLSPCAIWRSNRSHVRAATR